MLKKRIIPTLLFNDSGLVKGIKFKNHRYIGDPLNAVKIFNEKEVDEIVFLDISATIKKKPPNFQLISEIASELFVPFAYGGGIKSVAEIEKIFKLGAEKVIINSAAFYTPMLIQEASKIAGAQSIVVSMDVKKNWLGKQEVYINNGTTRTKTDPTDYAQKMQDLGAGEIIICSIDREGTGTGYDTDLLEKISTAVEIPVIASGGANQVQDIVQILKKTNVSGASAGSMFVFHGKHRAVLITYPHYSELEKLLNE